MYQLSKKAYWVGGRTEVKQPHTPETNCDLIYVDSNQERDNARLIYFTSHPNKPSNLRYIDVVAIRKFEEDLYLYEGTELTDAAIQQIEKTKQWREETEIFVLSHRNATVRIFSNEHRRYWLPGNIGYTHYLDKAGVFPIKQAWEFVKDCGAEKRIVLEIVDIDKSSLLEKFVRIFFPNF